MQSKEVKINTFLNDKIGLIYNNSSNENGILECILCTNNTLVDKETELCLLDLNGKPLSVNEE